jgi:hypothetical protein
MPAARLFIHRVQSNLAEGSGRNGDAGFRPLLFQLTAQIAQVAVDGNTVETVVYKNQQAAKQSVEGFNRSSLMESSDDTT